jgi:hypothetical protein
LIILERDEPIKVSSPKEGLHKFSFMFEKISPVERDDKEEGNQDW